MQMQTLLRRLSQPGFVPLLMGAVLGAALLTGLHALILRMHYEWSGPFTADSPIYWAVGRGILNGLLPYRDLFETKPPGIFLLSALSFALFNGPFLGNLIGALSMPFYPLLLGHATWRIGQQKHFGTMHRILCVMMAAITGIILALYTMERSGEFQVESFGAFFGLLYVWVIARTEKLSLIERGFAALFLLGMIGMKEPFLLTGIGAALVICSHDVKRLLHALVYPLLIAIVSGSVLMFALGYAIPYLTIYLPETLTQEIRHIHPLLRQLLDWRKIPLDLMAFVPALPFLIGSFICCNLLHPVARKNKTVFISLRTAMILLGIYLGITAVSLKGNYYNHHFAFITPVFVALVIQWTAHFDVFRKQHIALRFFSLCSFLLLLYTAFTLPALDYAGRLAPQLETIRIQKLLAKKIDATMDACGLDRYLFLGTNGAQPYGYTQHSPLGPVFFQLNHFLDPAFPTFRSTFVAHLAHAKLIVRQGGEFNDLAPVVQRYLTTYFTSDPWPCAKEILKTKMPSYQFLYRKD